MNTTTLKPCAPGVLPGQHPDAKLILRLRVMANCNACDTMSGIGRYSAFARGVIVARAREIRFWLKDRPDLRQHVILAIREGIASWKESAPLSDRKRKASHAS